MGVFFPPLPERRDFNYDRLRIWLGNQTISFQKVVTGSLQVGQEITSSNYVAGTSGWKIDGDGNAEFNDAVLRGDVVVGVDPEIITITNDASNYQIASGVYAASIIEFQNDWVTSETDQVEQNPAVFTMADGPYEESPSLFIAGPSTSSTTVGGAPYLILQTVLTTGFEQTVAGFSAEHIVLQIGDDGPGVDATLELFSDALVATVGSLGYFRLGDTGQFELNDNLGASAPAYTFVADLDTGIYRKSANLIGFSAGGTEKVTIGANGIKLIDGSVGSPSYSFISDTDTGFYWISSGAFGATNNGTLTVLFDGTTIRLPTHGTTSSGANVFMNSSSGVIARSTSSLKYKEGWEFVDEKELAKLELPAPIRWHDEVGGDMLGFGTEHLYEMLPAATQDEDEDGNPENYDPRALIAILSAKIKRLEALHEIKPPKTKAWRVRGES